jgi:hypothetical protein
MMKRTHLVVAVSVAVLISVGGCKQAKNEAPAPAPQAAQPAAPAVQASGGLSGNVVETMNSGGYTYVCLENSGKKTWVAMPQTKVSVGQQVTCKPGMEMKNFTSKTLKRTFESVIFSDGLI